MNIMTRHNVKWLAPSPMWKTDNHPNNSALTASFIQPAILRFANDSFMDELLAVLKYYPDYLPEWEAQPETWRELMPTPKITSLLKINEPLSEFPLKFRRQLPGAEQLQNDSEISGAKINNTDNSQKEELPFKLYQPAHQRYYLVSSSLVCRQPGLPDRWVDPGRQEQVSFVIRRLIHPKKDTDKLNYHSICNSENWKC